MELLSLPTIVLVSSLAINLILIIIFFHKDYTKDLQNSGEVIKNPVEEGYNLLHNAIKKAQDIVGQAELEEVKILANSRLQTKKFEEDIESKFETQTQKATDLFQGELSAFTAQIQRAQDQYAAYIATLQNKMNTYQEENKQLIKSQVANFFEQFEQNMSTFLTDTEQRSVSSIDLEMRAARQLIDTYKEEQLKLIDENIIAVLERTLSIVLGKKLSLKEQVDLVYESLGKAKAEKFIA